MKPENLPRQKDLDETLRGRKSGAMKDRRAVRGGARNMQLELLEEYEEDLVACENCTKKVPFKDCIIVNTEVMQLHFCCEHCARIQGEIEGPQ